MLFCLLHSDMHSDWTYIALNCIWYHWLKKPHLTDELEGNEAAQNAIAEAIDHWQDRTCIQFISITDEWEVYNDTKYLQFVDNAGWEK